jgi:hypothetical protein
MNKRRTALLREPGSAYVPLCAVIVSTAAAVFAEDGEVRADTFA